MNGRRRAVAASITLAAVVAVGVAPAAARGQGAVTNVSERGGVVTITVPIDLVPGSPEIASRMRQLKAKWESAAETSWNNAFDFFQFKCFTLRLDVQLKIRDEGFAGASSRHRVQVSAGGGGTPGFEGTAERNPDAGSNDGTRSFDTSRDGIWREDQSDTTTAHEVGHLLGLGDDYTVVSQNPRRTRANPGREGTLMGDGGVIDQALIDRIGKQIEKVTDRLPPCWEGPMRVDVTDAVPAGTCVGYWVAHVTLRVARDEGTGKAVVTDAPTNSCGISTFALVGQELPITMTVVPDGGFVLDKAFFGLPGASGPARIPATGRNRAHGRFTLSTPTADGGTITERVDVALACTTCR